MIVAAQSAGAGLADRSGAIGQASILRSGGTQKALRRSSCLATLNDPEIPVESRFNLFSPGG
jgi:hypothetical protein